MATDDAWRLQCAAALRKSSLSERVKDDSPLWPFEAHRWVPALEVVAKVALQNEPGTVRHAVAMAVLAKHDFAMRLVVGEERYTELGLQVVTRLPMTGELAEAT
jgi:hypothetical protein